MTSRRRRAVILRPLPDLAAPGQVCCCGLARIPLPYRHHGPPRPPPTHSRQDLVLAGHNWGVSSAASFEALVSSVYEPLQRFLRRRTDPTTADDVLGDVLLVMWRRIDEIPADAVLPWCYGVARGCLANSNRSDDRRLRLVRRIASEPPTAQADADPALEAAFHALPTRERELLRLWAWEGLPPREIGLVLGITPNAASLRLQRATKKLRAELLRRQGADVAGHVVERRGRETR